MSTSPKAPPELGTHLVDYPWVIIRFRCHSCERWGDARLTRCVAQYGLGVPLRDLLHIWMRQCPWNHLDPARYSTQKYGHRCGAYLPDVGRDTPPDLPPPMLEWTVVEGGRDELLPAVPAEVERRKRRRR